MPHTKLSNLNAFNSWEEAQVEFQKLVDEIVPKRESVGGPTMIGIGDPFKIGMELARFSFRLGLTAENERRKKR